MPIPDRAHSLRNAGLSLGCALSLFLLTACGGGGGGGGSTSGGGGTSGATYTVGGTVSGLSASGLVLTDNGGDNLTVASGATSFTFSTALASGASYSVAVATQPTGETCTISSGATGTASANVTSVVVGCTGNTYTVAGTISGLTAPGLQLQDYSGGETLTVTAGATTFQFTKAVASGTDVDVTVSTQPTWQTCTAGSSNFSGPITANVTTDTFSCATTLGVVTTFAAASSFPTNAGTAGVAVDSSGNVYVADSTASQIFEITPAGTVSTLAGNGTAGDVDGSGTTAEFNTPTAVAVDSSGNVYVADAQNDKIRKIVISGGTVTVSTLAGSGNPGAADGTGAAASFRYPEGVAVDPSSGNLYVADTQNDEIRMVTPTGVVTTVAGSTTAGYVNGSGTAAEFSVPKGVTVDSSGNIYVADTGNDVIRKIDSSFDVTLLAGTAGTAGHADGTGSAASFNGPSAVAVDSSGDVFVADSLNNEIRMVTPAGVVTTVAGSTTAGNVNGTGSAASFSSPEGIALDASGNLYVADLSNNEIRKVAQ